MIFEDEMPIHGPCLANLRHLGGQSLGWGELMRPLSSSLNKMKQTKKVVQLGTPAALRAESAICFGDWLHH